MKKKKINFTFCFVLLIARVLKIHERLNNNYSYHKYLVQTVLVPVIIFLTKLLINL